MLVRELEQYTPFRVLGGSGEFFRVQLPDGTNGYVAARLTESADEPYSAELASAGNRVLSRPDQGSPVMATLDREAEMAVLGRYGDFLMVLAPGGRTGWIGQAAQQQQ